MMDRSEFIALRKKLNKTQKQISQLLGKSLKAVHSYEQGWRTIPPDVQRQMLFLVSRCQTDGSSSKGKPCWTITKCPPERKQRCPAWEFNAGRLCWFVGGTICEGKARKTWEDKMEHCRNCEMMMPLIASDPVGREMA